MVTRWPKHVVKPTSKYYYAFVCIDTVLILEDFNLEMRKTEQVATWKDGVNTASPFNAVANDKGV